MSANAELQEAINNAAVEITKDLPADHPSKITTEAPAEAEVEETEEAEEAEETEVAAASELTQDELDEARRIYKALKDPKDGPALVAALAQRSGLLNQPLETKAEVKEAKKDILSIFKEELGESYAFLAPKLATAVDKALDTVRAEQAEQVAELQVHNLTTEVNGVLSKIAKETNGESRKLETKVAALMDEYPIGRTGNIEKYIRDMFTMASSGKMKANVEKSTADRIRRNANNVADRLQRTSSAPSTDTLPGKRLGLKGSIEWAAAQLQKGNK